MLGNATGLTCPECSGALWEVKEPGLIQYRCRVGHAYSPESMLAEQSRSVESALWAGVVALEERVHLMRRIANRAASGKRTQVQDQFNNEAEHTQRQADVPREAVTEYSSRELSVLSRSEDQHA
ncbi:MAG: hypothetical protein ACRDJY_08530 [Thermoleophilaceae bacterium]